MTIRRRRVYFFRERPTADELNERDLIDRYRHIGPVLCAQVKLASTAHPIPCVATIDNGTNEPLAVTQDDGGARLLRGQGPGSNSDEGHDRQGMSRSHINSHGNARSTRRA